MTVPTIAKRSEKTQVATDKLTPSTYVKITTSAPFIAQDWKQEAECLRMVANGQVDPLLWFPVAEKDHVPNLVKAICERCEVRLECLCYAIYTNEPDGIWGGHSTKAVRRIGKRIVSILRTRRP